MVLIQSEPKSIKIGTTDIKRVTIRPNGTEKQIRPVGWQPGANTLFYASLNGNYNASGTLSPTYNTSSGVTYNSLGDIQYASISNGQMVWDITAPSTNVLTLQTRVTGVTEGVVAVGVTNWTGMESTTIELYFDGSKWCVYTQSGTSWSGLADNTNINTWCLITGVKDGTTLYLYRNSTLIGSTTCASTLNQKTQLIIANNSVRPATNVTMNVSNIIFEDKVRTAQEISDYYNLTKGNYGL